MYFILFENRTAVLQFTTNHALFNTDRPNGIALHFDCSHVRIIPVCWLVGSHFKPYLCQ